MYKRIFYKAQHRNNGRKSYVRLLSQRLILSPNAGPVRSMKQGSDRVLYNFHDHEDIVLPIQNTGVVFAWLVSKLASSTILSY